MRKTIIVCGVEVEVDMERVEKSKVPSYIRVKFGKDDGYLQKKRNTKKWVYFFKEATGFYMGDVPFEEVA